MKALILNSGLGSRMGDYTSSHPKCMTEISANDTILSRQLKMLSDIGISEVIMTTGYLDDVLKEYCKSLSIPISIHFIKNPRFDTTNYIYSIYCAKDYLKDDDILLMHGDLVFDESVLDEIVSSQFSCMVVSSEQSVMNKDFKANVQNGFIKKVAVDITNDPIAAQALYKLKQNDWLIWLNAIIDYCEKGETNCYAENAFNEVSEQCLIRPVDIKHQLCCEIDTMEDLMMIKEKINDSEEKIVYMSFSTDIIHSGHISIIRKAEKLGKVIVGVLKDDVVMSYKRFPLLPFEERKLMFENIIGISKVVPQDTLSYKDNLLKYKPDYVVHGDDWTTGRQKPIRDEVVDVLSSYGGQLIEYPYSRSDKYNLLDKRASLELSTPDFRRGRLKRVIETKGLATAIEAHSGLTGLIAEKVSVDEDGGIRQFDAMWISSLCDSTAKGKPDIELVDMTSRFRTIDDIMEVTTKPIIFDGDTGGLAEHFVYTVKTLERMGVSMVIIEDKTGLKRNSLFGTEVEQTQVDIESFCNKIAAGKKAQNTKEFMICARIESLILEKGCDDAIERAFAYTEAGADAIMIHSRKKEPDEIFEFVKRYRDKYNNIPIVVVPTSFNTVTEEEFLKAGVNVVIYANQLTRTGFPAMKKAAEMILANHRAKECDDICMPFKEIITLIPEER